MPLTDGRRRRTHESHERIVEAMFTLINSGNLRPSAEDIAAEANVGLRSVFRHFKDMESLFMAVAAKVVQVFQPSLAPFESQDWRGRLFEALDRRIGIYETLMNFRRAGEMHAYESETIRNSNMQIRQILRARLPLFLPPHLMGDVVAFETLDLLLSFEGWMALRDSQNLSPETARAVIEGLLKAFFDAPAAIAR